jgi:hypothetical protein
MDTQQTAATERAAALRKQLAALASEKQKTESKLAEEHATIRRAALKRGGLVESLIGVNEAVSRRAHKELDELDSVIRVSERMAESFQKALAKAGQEEATLCAEFHEAERQVQAEERAKGLEALQINLKQAARRASEDLDNSRKSLAALSLLAGKGMESYGENAQRICSPIFQEFFDGQNNMGPWKIVHSYWGDLRFLIRPMTRG